MFYTRVKPMKLGARLDANFYSPAYLENESRLLLSGAKNLASLCDYVACGPFGGNAIADDLYAENGVAFIRPINISSNIFDSSQLVRVPQNLLEANNLKIYEGVNLYFGRVGDPCVALIDGKTSISPNIIVAKVNADLVDAHYLHAFVSTKFGMMQLKRQLKTVAQPTTSTEAIKDLLICLPLKSVQKYIGDKVRQAELLREWAKILRNEIKSYFNKLFEGIDLSSPVQRYSTVSIDNLVPRLNAEYYAEQYLQVEKYLKNKFGVLATIGELAPTVRSKARPIRDCIYKEIGDLDTATGKFSQGTHYTYFDVPNNAQRVFDAGDVAISTRRPNRGAIAVVEESSKDIFYSVFLARLKPKNKNLGYWLKEYLRHEAGKLLLLQRCTWTTYPVISEDDLETVPVPKLSDDWEYIAKLSIQSVLLEEYATKLMNVTKEIVESLIEGNIEESSLINIQNALEQGDTSLDHAILSQMTEDGYAVAGSKPLFSDIDEFYDLLEQAKALE